MSILNKNNVKYKVSHKSVFGVVFFLCLFTFLAIEVDAVTLNKNIYYTGEEIIAPNGSGPVVIYSVDTGAPLIQLGGLNPEESITTSFDNYVGRYSILEITDPGLCGEGSIPEEPYYLTYLQCKVLPEFIDDFTFKIIKLPSSMGGDDDPILDPELNPAKGDSYTSYSPEVNIFSVFKGSLFSDNLIIDYKATDQNDDPSDKQQSSHGLSDNPVIISYSEKVSDWFSSLSLEDEIEIARDQPKEGQYKWSVKDLIPGSLYRIVVDVVDLSGLWGQGISDFFGVDFISPVFTIKASPEAVRSGDVLISVDSSEDLREAPEIIITQNGGEPAVVLMKGDKSHYEGIYHVVSGFDGTASVKVSGIDTAGNKGDTIVSGGVFSVGVNPPPKPRINNYTEKIVTNEEFINVSGSVRIDTSVILMVDGVEISEIKPDSKGNFIFEKIKLDKKKNNGLNYINIISRDPVGTTSESSLIQVKYNIAPTVKIIKPLEDEIISNISSINVSGTDENNDTIFYTYQSISLADFNNKIYNWTTLLENSPSNSFSWNTTEAEDGSYMIRVVANDGNTKTESNPVKAVIKNVLPSFRFEDGRNTITNLSEISIKGKAVTSTNITPRPSIVSVAYSMDAGKTWAPVKISDDKGPYEKKFSVPFSSLKEGTYPILWRTKDSRGFIGKIVHSIVVDKTPPKIPTITSPRQDKEVFINDTNDENTIKTGVQIGIKGTTEPSGLVTLIFNNQIFTTKSLPTGSFSFSDITFDKKGKYELKVFVNDIAGNKSLESIIPITYNNLPKITFINPKPFGGLSGKVSLSWSVKDIDGDPLNNITISYRNKNKETQFKDLILNAQSAGTYIWDTTSLAESNNYELKISASDLFGTISSVESFSIDHTPPVLSSFVFDKNQMELLSKKISFYCKGEMTDNLSGIEFIEYFVEGNDGKISPWYKGVITSGFLKNKATFSIKHPIITEDGGYKVYARAVDRASNLSAPLLLSLSVDKTAPRIGSFYFTKKGVDLTPDQNGNVSIYKNSTFTFSVALEGDTENASIKIGSKIFLLKKDEKSQLWTTDISIGGESSERILITVSDSSGNILKNQEIGNINIVPRGTVYLSNHDGLVGGATVKVLKLNNSTNQYNDFVFLNDNNPEIVSSQDGEYELVLPPGSYKFIISGSDIRTLKYSLDLNRPSVVAVNFEVSPVSGLVKFINNLLNIFK